MYKIIFDKKSISFLEKIQNNIKKQIFNKIILTKENPHYFFERLSGRADYKLRVGNYRIIADIDEKTKTIQITLIGHRKNIYKK